MENSGLYWDKREDEQLKNLYVKYKMDIFEISQIHKRTSNAIQRRLEYLGLNESKNNCNENTKLLIKINNLEKELILLNERVKKLEDAQLNGID
jgi:hypothetical protein